MYAARAADARVGGRSLGAQATWDADPLRGPDGDHGIATDLPAQSVSLPTVDGDDDVIEDIDGDSGTSLGSVVALGGASTGSDACAQPLGMTKVVSGAFQGAPRAFTLDDYYPDLVGRGFWQHGGSGGTWDTGTRVGASAQLIGQIASPCRPTNFSLAQTVTYRKKIIDGVHDPREGVVQDDIAKSGRNAANPPFRLEWMGGDRYNISMADPPSINYGAASNIEHDREFTTSLIGPGGRSSVSWATSIRVVNGTVTQNTIT